MLRILPNGAEGAINLIIFKTELGRLMKKFIWYCCRGIGLNDPRSHFWSIFI